MMSDALHAHAAEPVLPPPRARARVAWPPWLDSGLALVCLAGAEAAVLTEGRYGDLELLVSVLLMVVATLPWPCAAASR